MSAAAADAAFPRHFSKGDQLLCWCIHGEVWQLATVIEVYTEEYDPQLAHIGRRDARIHRQQQQRLKQIRVHFSGWDSVWDSDVLLCDVPARLLPVCAAAAKGIALPQPGQHENDASCFNCGDGGEAFLCLCDGCSRSWHADCLLFLGKAEVKRARARSLFWHCPLCHHDEERMQKLIHAEADKNRRVRAAELAVELRQLETERAAYESSSGDDDFMLHRIVAATERAVLLQQAKKRDRKDKMLKPRKRRKRLHIASEEQQQQQQQPQQQHSSVQGEQQQEEQEQEPREDEEQQPQQQEEEGQQEREHGEEQQPPVMDLEWESEPQDVEEQPPVRLEAQQQLAELKAYKHDQAVKLEAAVQQRQDEQELADVELLSPIPLPARMTSALTASAILGSLPELVAASAASPLPAPTVPSALRRRVLCAPAPSFSAAHSSDRSSSSSDVRLRTPSVTSDSRWSFSSASVATALLAWRPPSPPPQAPALAEAFRHPALEAGASLKDIEQVLRTSGGNEHLALELLLDAQQSRAKHNAAQQDCWQLHDSDIEGDDDDDDVIVLSSSPLSPAPTALSPGVRDVRQKLGERFSPHSLPPLLHSERIDAGKTAAALSAASPPLSPPPPSQPSWPPSSSSCSSSSSRLPLHRTQRGFARVIGATAPLLPMIIRAGNEADAAAAAATSRPSSAVAAIASPLTPQLQPAATSPAPEAAAEAASLPSASASRPASPAACVDASLTAVSASSSSPAAAAMKTPERQAELRAAKQRRLLEAPMREIHRLGSDDSNGPWLFGTQLQQLPPCRSRKKTDRYLESGAHAAQQSLSGPRSRQRAAHEEESHLMHSRDADSGQEKQQQAGQEEKREEEDEDEDEEKQTEETQQQEERKKRRRDEPDLKKQCNRSWSLLRGQPEFDAVDLSAAFAATAASASSPSSSSSSSWSLAAPAEPTADSRAAHRLCLALLPVVTRLEAEHKAAWQSKEKEAKAAYKEAAQRREAETATINRCMEELDLIDSWMRRIKNHRSPAIRSNIPVPPFALHIPQTVLQLVQQPHCAAVAARVQQVEDGISQRGLRPISYRTQDPAEHAAFLQQLSQEELSALKAALRSRATRLQAAARLTVWLPSQRGSCSICSRPERPAACTCADRVSIGRTLTATPTVVTSTSSDSERRRAVWTELAAADSAYGALDGLKAQLLMDAETLDAEQAERIERSRVPALSLMLESWKTQQGTALAALAALART